MVILLKYLFRYLPRWFEGEFFFQNFTRWSIHESADLSIVFTAFFLLLLSVETKFPFLVCCLGSVHLWKFSLASLSVDVFVDHNGTEKVVFQRLITYFSQWIFLRSVEIVAFLFYGYFLLQFRLTSTIFLLKWICISIFLQLMGLEMILGAFSLLYSKIEKNGK